MDEDTVSHRRTAERDAIQWRWNDGTVTFPIMRWAAGSEHAGPRSWITTSLLTGLGAKVCGTHPSPAPKVLLLLRLEEFIDVIEPNEIDRPAQ